MMEASYYIGLNLSHVNPSATLVKDGRIVFHIEEERLVREKLARNRFPALSVSACLDYARIGLKDVEAVLLGYDLDLFTLQVPIHYLRELHAYPGKDSRSIDWEVKNLANKHPQNMVRYVTDNLQREGHEVIPRICWYNHHLCHAHTAFYGSGYETALVVVVDAVGETDCLTVWSGSKGSGLTKLATVGLPNSLGWIYRSFTLWAGLPAYEGEGMLMGLAPYGKPVDRYRDEMTRVIRWDEHDAGTYAVDPHFIYVGPRTLHPMITDRLIEVFGPAANGEPEQRHRDVAFALQERLEETMDRLVTEFLQRTALRRLCLAGGVALNCKANGVVWKRARRRNLLDSLYVYPVASDDGIGMGSCMAYHKSKGGEMSGFTTAHVFLGPCYDSDQIGQAMSDFRLRSRFLNPQQYEAIVRNTGLRVELTGESIRSVLENGERSVIDDRVRGVLRGARRSPCIEQETAELLADGRLVAWFQGRMEVGPRALGSRSILADPRRAESRDKANEKVKFRQPWRPFCPSVLDTEASKFFEDITDAPFMIVAFDARPDRADEVPAVVHVDGTARIQLVSRDHNERFYTLLQRFRSLTGVGMLLNTSLNIKGEPICCTPEDALNLFFATDIDVLVMDTWILTKQ